MNGWTLVSVIISSLSEPQLSQIFCGDPESFIIFYLICQLFKNPFLKQYE